MSEIKVLPMGSLGHGFIGGEFVPDGQDEYYLRNQQAPRPEGGWRHLKADEIEILVKNANVADNWDNLLVSDPFSAHSVKNC